MSFDPREQMHRFVSHMQVLAGHLNELPAPELLDRFEELAVNIPHPGSRVEQLAINTLLTRAVERLLDVLRAKSLGITPDSMNAEHFTATIRALRDNMLSGSFWRIIEFHEVLRRTYSEPSLSLVNVAKEMRLSPSHLSRILRRRTGRGFSSHLHEQRVRQAMELLIHSTLSVKEICARIGYLRTSQFDRHFRALIGMTPSKYRSGRFESNHSQQGILRADPNSSV